MQNRKELSNIVEIKCLRFWSDFTEEKAIQIDLTKYTYFEIIHFGKNSWNIRGCTYTELDRKGDVLTFHEVSNIEEVAKFVAHADVYALCTGGHQGCKVTRFSDVNFCSEYTKELLHLLNLVEEEKKKLLEQE